MKNIINYTLIFTICALTTITSCKKDKDDTVTPSPTPSGPTYGKINLEFENVVGDSALVFNTKTYQNAAGNDFTISTLKYYISNVKLIKADGSIYTENNSYHLIDANDDLSTLVTLDNVPLGNYTSLSFMIGVDSTRNVSGAQTGALDPANGMFWSWSSGYIMAKFEGTSPQSTVANNIVLFHVGGFSGTNSVLKTVSPSFSGATANVTSSFNPEIHMKVDMLKWFTGTNSINFSTLNTIHMPGVNAKKIADNYADMISVEHIHNN